VIDRPAAGPVGAARRSTVPTFHRFARDGNSGRPCGKSRHASPERKRYWPTTRFRWWDQRFQNGPFTVGYIRCIRATRHGGVPPSIHQNPGIFLLCPQCQCIARHPPAGFLFTMSDPTRNSATSLFLFRQTHCNQVSETVIPRIAAMKSACLSQKHIFRNTPMGCALVRKTPHSNRPVVKSWNMSAPW
jgi:hypothetical protein